MKTHDYSNNFFDYIDDGARTSAQQFISLLTPWLHPKSVLDLGSGRGAWLQEWVKSGISDVVGVDGHYVDKNNLAIPAENFIATDLTKALTLNRRFDLAQSLEVGEHLPNSASATLVESLVNHSDRILFSAAVPGQGGEFHINEKPLEFWRQLFRANGYAPYDCIRPLLRNVSDVEPWYRYNSILYLNDVGLRALPNELLATRVPDELAVPHCGSLSWRLRKVMISALPQSVVTTIASRRAVSLTRKRSKIEH